MAITLTPYINFVDNAQEALDFYQGVLGGETDISRFGDLPEMPVEDRFKNLIMHASLKSPDFEIMISDSAPMGGVKQDGENVSISLFGDDDATLSRYFEGLSAGGQVTAPLAMAPWGDKFGMFTDKFGIHWMVNISQPQNNN